MTWDRVASTVPLLERNRKRVQRARIGGMAIGAAIVALIAWAIR